MTRSGLAIGALHIQVVPSVDPGYCKFKRMHCCRRVTRKQGDWHLRRHCERPNTSPSQGLVATMWPGSGNVFRRWTAKKTNEGNLLPSKSGTMALMGDRFLRPGKDACNYRYQHNGEIYHEDVESDRCAYAFLPYEGHVGFVACHSK
jgi:hypothetical protein